MRNRIAVGLAAFLLLPFAGCATPEVDSAMPRFDETAYLSDLNLCRGGNFIVASARTIGLAMLGSAYGAIYGVRAGARHGDTAERAAVGAVLGGAVGLGAGATAAIRTERAEIAQCLAEKGYRVAG